MSSDESDTAKSGQSNQDERRYTLNLVERTMEWLPGQVETYFATLMRDVRAFLGNKWPPNNQHDLEYLMLVADAFSAAASSAGMALSKRYGSNIFGVKPNELKFPAKDTVTDKELAKIAGVSPRTVRRCRHEHVSPRSAALVLAAMSICEAKSMLAMNHRAFEKADR